MRVIKIFYDLETTGTNSKKNCIHQLAGCVEVDDVIDRVFNFKMAPPPGAIIDPAALLINDVTEEQIHAYPDQAEIFREFKKLLKSYIDPFDRKQKAYLVGFNNRAFDDVFLRCWFDINKDSTYGAFFFVDSLDAMVLAAQYLIPRRDRLQSFKLVAVARELGLIFDKNNFHDAYYDVDIMRQIYRIVTGLETEI